MNLKLSALIFLTSTLISLSTSFPQQAKDDELEELRATLHDLAQRPAPTLEVVPVDFSDLNPSKKREAPKLPPVFFFVCTEALFQGRCEKLRAKRGFCCTCCFSPALTPLPKPCDYCPFFGMRVQYLTIIMIILDTLKNGFNDKISSFCPEPLTKCTVYE